jgi:hypothetical protein
MGKGSYAECWKITVASGGKVRESEAERPCHGIGSAKTMPEFPTFDPP